MKWRPTKGPTISEQSNNYLQLSYSLWESVLNQEKLSCFSPPYGGGDKSGGRMVFGLYARNKASCPGLWVRINPDYQIQNSEEEPRSTSTKFRNQELKCEGEDWRQTPIQHTGKAAHWRQARGMVWKILRKQNQVEVAFVWMREWREESMVSPKLCYWLSASQTGKNQGGAGLRSRKESWIWDILSAIQMEISLHCFIHSCTYPYASENLVRNIDMAVITAIVDKIAHRECFKWEEIQR